MGFKSFNKQIILRLLGLLVTMFFLVAMWLNNVYLLSIILMAVLLAVQVNALYHFLNKSNNEVIEFLDSIRYDDLSITYPTNKDNTAVNKLHEEFNKVMDRFKEIRLEKEADFQYMKNIIQHVGIGLITFNKKGEVQLVNAAAKKLLDITQIKHVDELGDVHPELVAMLHRLKTGGRDLLKLEMKGEITQLAIYAIELTLRGEEFKLISIQNIHNELEEKEMDAWQNLVRVLTHEIMNSVTPISSLAKTVEDELKPQLSNDQDVNSMTNDEVEDLYQAVQTIQKRSTGLIRFVQDFRSLTHVPKPKFKKVSVSELINDIMILLKKEIKQSKISLSHSTTPKNLSIQADKELIEQVLINLIKNAMQSFEDQTNRLVEVKATVSDKGRPVISVRDNGNGIDKDALEKIFIPFFTTKKQGSGIGLSLSRQIMRKHQGMLTVKSVLDEGTEFQIRF